MTALVLLLLAAEPVELETHGALELSDIVWLQSLDRFVMVTDEAPYLVTMNAKGVVDEARLKLDGINDAEALTLGPNGTLFLSTSHSPNKKGKLKAERRQLLWLSVVAGEVKVKGRLDLTTVRNELDVEALAFVDDALLVGLKSPLTKDGRATILKISDIERVFQRGKIVTEDVSVFSELALRVKNVPQGVSALARLADGRWVIGANAPKNGVPDGGGALWLLDRGAPRLLRHFDRLKPEGITVAPDGSLVVVFDEGAATPKWLRMPAP